MVILASVALAAPVICDPERAERLVADARIPLDRVPATQPNLLPGLARAHADPVVLDVLTGLCEGDAALSMAPAERFESAERSAYSFVLTDSETVDCALVQDSVVLTVGIAPGGPLRYGIRAERPMAITPIGPCDTEAIYQSERILQGDGRDVQLVLVTDHEGRATQSRVVVRRATSRGWVEQVLLDPAPDRFVDGGGGPSLTIHTANGETWIVAHGDRVVDALGCRPVAGQRIWRWTGEAWDSLDGRAAMGRLADRGLWRLAGQPGWFLILAQDIPKDRDLLQARMRRIQRRAPEPLFIRESAMFPGMNAGFLVISPDPWASEAEARAAMRDWGRRTGVYIKRGWSPINSCTR